MSLKKGREKKSWQKQKPYLLFFFIKFVFNANDHDTVCHHENDHASHASRVNDHVRDHASDHDHQLRANDRDPTRHVNDHVVVVVEVVVVVNASR